MAYDNFIAGSPIYFQTAKDYFTNEYQAFVDDQFSIATDVYDVYKETYFSSGSYEPISVRINHAIDSETGLKLGDDFKVIIFKNTGSDVELGEKFWFDNNYYLTVNTDNAKGLTSSVTVRRCNNVLRWKTDSGSYLSEPCIIDYRVSTPNNKNKTDPLLPEGTINIIAQLNTRTRIIEENQRFLFGNTNLWQCYRIYGGGVNNFLNNQTENNSTAQLVEFAMGKDYVNQNTDNLDYGIADYYKYESGSAIVSNIEIIPISGSIVESGSQVFSVYLYSGTTQLSDVFTFTVSGSSTVPANNYTFASVDDNHFSVVNNERYLSDPLLIQCQSGSSLRVFNIWLRGKW